MATAHVGARRARRPEAASRGRRGGPHARDPQDRDRRRAGGALTSSMVIDALLQPISPSSPGGDDPSGEQQFIKLTQAIRPPSYGREPDYGVAEDLAASLLASKTKDLQVAAFYTEALVHRRGFSGLADGLVLLHGLLDRYWDSLHPRDHGHRRGPLASLASEDFAITI